MPVLAIVEIEGDPDALKRASDELCARIGMAHGLLARVVAPTERGIVLVNVWASEELRQASNAWVQLAGGTAPASG
jgi:hypothetical protein